MSRLVNTITTYLSIFRFDFRRVTASLDGVMAPVSKLTIDASVQVPIAVQKAILLIALIQTKVRNQLKPEFS